MLVPLFAKLAHPNMKLMVDMTDMMDGFQPATVSGFSVPFLWYKAVGVCIQEAPWGGKGGGGRGALNTYNKDLIGFFKRVLTCNEGTSQIEPELFSPPSVWGC